jgi:hypothetical protein
VGKGDNREVRLHFYPHLLPYTHTLKFWDYWCLIMALVSQGKRTGPHMAQLPRSSWVKGTPLHRLSYVYHLLHQILPLGSLSWVYPGE